MPSMDHRLETALMGHFCSTLFEHGALKSLRFAEVQ